MSERTDADRRAILREHGHEVTNRGKLRPELRELADAIAAGAEPGSPPAEEAEYDAGLTAADFGDLENDGPAPDLEDEEEPTVPLPPERKPRAVKATAAPLRSRLLGRKKPQQGKKRVPRVSTDRLISGMWEGLARLAAPVSQPVARTLTLQAPVAGLILDDTVKGTIVDRVLQPAARAHDKGKKVFALAAPPLLVAAMEQAQGLPEPARSTRTALLTTLLAEALTMWVEVAGDKVEAAAARHAENQATRAEVEKLMNLIFAPPGEVVPEPEMAGAAA